jgi:transcriptional regulator with XRE-family HTH domain
MGKRPQGDLELYKFIGNQIKKARLANEPARMDGQKNPSAMTQTALGNAIGVTFQQVQKYEKGVNRVPIDKLLAIGIKTKKEDINYFLPNDISGETLVSVEEIPIKFKHDVKY